MVANSIFRACVTSVVRLAYLPRLLLSVDVSCMSSAESFYLQNEVGRANRSSGKVVPVAMLDVVEQSLGIITASLPALTAFIAKYVNIQSPFWVVPVLTAIQGLGVI